MADLSSLLGAAGIGGAIGKAIVSLELDTKKYMAELKGAEAQTVASTNKSSAAFGSFGSFANKALLGVGAAAVAGAALSIKAAIEANEAHLKLQNTFENNAKLSDSSVEAFEKQAEALQLLTGESDEAIITSQALLGQFDITGKQVEALIPLVVDLSTKMGIDMTAAAKSVGKAVIGNTAGLQRYGIVIEEASGAGGEFDAVLQGLQGTVGGFAEARAAEEPWRRLAAQFDEVAEDIGNALLPLLKDLTGVIETLVPAVEFAARNIEQLLIIAAGFVVWSQWATLIGAVTFALDTLAVSAVGAATALGGLAKVLPLAFLGLGGYIEDVRGQGIPIVERFTHAQNEANRELEVQKAKAALAEAGITNLSGSVEAAEREYVSFGNKLSKANREIADSIRGEIPAIVGSVTTMKETFDITPKELAEISHEWAKIGRRIARDLEIIRDADLKPATREMILALPPEMRDAWARGNDKIRASIEADLKTTYASEGMVNRLAAQAIRGFKPVGTSMTQGIVQGLESGQGDVYSKVRSIVDTAIREAETEAEADSPSKRMAELGLDLMEGLYRGISSGAQKVIDATRKAIEKTIEGISAELDKAKGKMADFASTISGAIGGFGGIGSAFGQGEIPVGAVIAQQLGGAQQLAAVLEALKRQGAGQALLSEVAGAGAGFGQAILAGGPEQVRAANAALQEIASLARETGKGLSEAFFGKEVNRLDRRLERQNDLLKELVEVERLGHTHAIILEGQKVSEALRSELIKTGKRNPGTGIN